MANSRAFFSDLKSGKCSSIVEARLLRFWEARNVKRGEIYGYVSNSNANAVGVLRYRVELVIADDTAEGAFGCFDGVMTKLHNLRAAEAGVNPEDITMPPFITDMEGKTFTFQVRVNTYNFTAHHQTFTITHILTEHERVPVPDYVVDVETEEGSSDGDKNVKENITAAAPKKRTHGPTNVTKKALLLEME
ncbi:hypothetical protein YC2023_019910 [Brassica napus]